MSPVQDIFGGLNLSSLKKFRLVFPKGRQLFEEVRALSRAKRDNVESHLSPDFAWAELYELNIKEMNILSLAAMGLLDMLIQTAQTGSDLNQFIIEETIRSSETENEGGTWSGGHEGQFTEADMFAVYYANIYSMRCLGIYGHYLNDLVSIVGKGGEGSDEAFFKAVTIDRSVLTCSAFAARLARAEFFDDKKFFLRLRKAIKGKPHDNLLVHQDLRLILQLLHETQSLNALTLSDADVLFIKELKLYTSCGEDPARSLMRFIQRWKHEKQSAT